jgi:hypothetical protein
MSILQKLTEGIVDRDLAKEGAALQSKWEKTGLLEGIGDDRERASMSRLLENQAKELLREASTMAAGDVEGFAAVAFPIVRRVFGGLLANDLVSVQPMSLPSGLIFFLDFTYSSATRLGVDQNDSLYGGGVVGSQLTGGVSDIEESGGGFYNLANAYTSPTGSSAAINVAAASTACENVAINALSEAQRKQLRFDVDLLGDLTSTNVVSVLAIPVASIPSDLNEDLLTAISADLDSHSGETNIRRLTHYDADGNINVVFTHATDAGVNTDAVSITYPVADAFTTADATGGVKGTSSWPLELATDTLAEAGADKDIIPEIDIKVDSIAVTAVTKKLKAKWSPELGQDLNAYHNLDAEVELTSILSEQIALEIDREIVNDLIQGATAGTYYWSRSPGLFVNRSTGVELGAAAAAPDFTGTVSEWYETLIETINDVSAQIHRKTLRGGANFLVTSPEVANILEFTAGFRANVTADADRGTVGAVNVGSVSKKFDVYVDPYFPRNVVLVGRKGGSFLESGYVYAPYVPLQVTPTIFGTEDFVPRKGVMTRYAKKMVRPDMYGLVICRGLLGEEGSS